MTIIDFTWSLDQDEDEADVDQVPDVGLDDPADPDPDAEYDRWRERQAWPEEG